MSKSTTPNVSENLSDSVSDLVDIDATDADAEEVVDLLNEIEAEIDADGENDLDRERQASAPDDAPTADEEKAKTILEFYESRFGGGFPEIPAAKAIDYQGLLQDDPDPFFITLPIAKVGAVSKNGLVYTRELVKSIVEQINAKRITGIRGHLPDDVRGHAYPKPEVYWIGAILKDDVAFAKGYIPPGETREEFRTRKRLKMDVATSIYGRAQNIREIGGGRYTAEIELEQIDLAPPERAALSLQQGFAITKEVEQKYDVGQKRSKKMDMEQLKSALESMDLEEIVKLLGDRVAQIAEWYAKNAGMKMTSDDTEKIAEMERRANQSELRIAELERTLAEYQRRERDLIIESEIANLTDWRTSDTEDKDALLALRRTLKTLVVAELQGDSDVRETARRVFENNQAIVTAVRDRLAGGPPVIGKADKAPRLATPAEIAAARSRLGW